MAFAHLDFFWLIIIFLFKQIKNTWNYFDSAIEALKSEHVETHSA